MQAFAPQTAAIQHPISIKQGPVMFVAQGLAGAETIVISVYNGAAYIPAEDNAGVAYVLTATQPMLVLPAPGEYRLDKGATAGAASCAFYANAT